MGLDVYMKHYKSDPVVIRALQAEAEAALEEKGEEKVDYDALYAGFGLKKWGEHPDEESVEFPSAQFPDHLFKVGYFRSSYNDGGINNVLGNLGVPTLYDIFVWSDDEYTFFPDWTDVLTRTEDAIRQLAVAPGISISFEGANPFMEQEKLCTSPEDAMSIVLGEISKNEKARAANPDRPPFDAYSCGSGLFYMGEPLEVIAMIPGFGFGKSAGVYYAYKRDLSFYQQALAIVRETCEYVLAQPDPERYGLSWSG